MSFRPLMRLICDGMPTDKGLTPCPDAAVWPTPLTDQDPLPSGWSQDRCPKCEAQWQAARPQATAGAQVSPATEPV